MGRAPRLWLFVAVLAASPATASGQGRVVRDGTLGSGPLEVAPGIDPLGQPASYLITPQMGEQHGSNLFHSFRRFGIGHDETATFTGPDPIEGPQSVSNVISRVTGGDPSEIDGTLRSTIPGADVWLLNPSGVVFGEGAQLDVPGSFHASTGDYLGFGGGDLVRFYADPARPSVLSAARPEAFGFLGENAAAAISVNGAVLDVNAGKAIELTGGDVTLTDATLDAPAGSISIRGGRIVVEDGIVLASAAGEDAGTISVAASESVAVNRGFLAVDAFGTGDAGTVTIGAESLTVAGGGIGANSGEGLAGHIGIDARSVEVSDSFVFAGAFGDGAGGTIDIDADELIVRGISPAKGIDVGTHGSGNGGTITIGDVATPLRSLTLSDGGYVSAVGYGSGNAGSITIAADSLLVNGTSPAVGSNIGVGSQGGGNAGSITIDADSVSIRNGGGINASSFTVPVPVGSVPRGGDAGTIRVTASESISVSNEGGEPFSLSRALLGGILLERLATTGIGSHTVFGGQGGSVTLEAPEITVSHGALVGSSTVGGGDAGKVLLQGENIHVVDGGNVNSASLRLFGNILGGQGGDIELVASESIEVAGLDPHPEAADNRSAVTASTLGSGPGGSVTLRAPRIVVEDGGIVQTTAVQAPRAPDAEGRPISGHGNARGGDITLDASDEVIVRSGGLVDASSFVRDRDGEVSAGDVLVTAGGSIRVEGEGSRIESRTGGEGTGGNVALRGPRIEITDDGIVSARSAPGYQGVSFAILERDRLVPRAPDTAAGNAGAVNLDATEVRLVDGGTIATNAEAADGGNVTIQAKELVHLDAGEITATVSGGKGGNIEIDPDVVILQNGSRIEARAGTGTGGRIEITTDNYFAFPGTVVSAAAEDKLGIDGVVEVHAPDVDLAGKITSLPTTFLDAASLMRERCAARRSGERAGSFAVRGNGGIPPEPDGWLPASVTFGSAGEQTTALRRPPLASPPLLALGSCR